MSVISSLFLRPGDYFFGRHDGPVTTLLGSCVSIILWHPRWRLLSVSHYVLPRDPARSNGPDEDADTRYGEAVFRRLEQDMQRFGTRPGEYRKSLFGGGTLSGSPRRGTRQVGHSNSEFALRQFQQRNWQVDHCDLEGDLYRRLSIDGHSGRIDCERKLMRLALQQRRIS